VLGAWLAASAQAQDREETRSAAAPRIALLLDASGSMWADLGDRTRIEVARDVVRDLLEDWDRRAELGLTVYGHRRRRDCEDIETLVPVGPADREALESAVRGVEPRGMTPLGAALEHAATGLRWQEQRAAVVLVSDGRETCGADPCAVARSLERRGVDFAAHVIGFDLAEEERSELRCVADATGGLFLAAGDATSLLTALRAAVQSESGDDPGLWLGAALSPSAAPLRSHVAWWIHPLREDGGLAAPVVVERSPTLSPVLPPGRYRVRAEAGGVQGVLELEVAPGRGQRRMVVLDAARLDLWAVGPAGARLEEGLRWSVRAADGRQVAQSRSATPQLVLRAGRYRVEARHGGESVARAWTLRPGQSLRKQLQFGVGRLALHAVMTDGRMPVDRPLRWRLTRVAGEGAEPRGEPAVEVEAPTLVRTLESGWYCVSARYGDAEVRDWVRVAAGNTRRLGLDLAAGAVRVFGSLPPPGGPIHEPVEWRVMTDGADDTVARERAASHVFVLPAGDYRIAGRLGPHEAAAHVRIRPGEESSLNLVFR